MKLDRHLLMVLGCFAAAALLFALPALGVKGEYTILLFLGAMLACHFLMESHGGRHEHKTEGKETKQEVEK